MSAPKVVEARTLTVSYEIEAEVYSDGTVGASGWTRRTADEWKKASSDNDYTSDRDRAEAKALYALALEVAPKPAEPTRYGFVGTVTRDEGVEYDVIATPRPNGRKYFEVRSVTTGFCQCFDKWSQVLDLGTFTPRGDA